MIIPMIRKTKKKAPVRRAKRSLNKESTMVRVNRKRRKKRTTRRRRRNTYAPRKNARRVVRRVRKNPVRRYRRRRRNPAASYYKPRRRRMSAPATRVNRKRRRRTRRRVRRNPRLGIRTFTSRQFITGAVRTAGGIGIGFMALPIVYKFLPENMKTGQADKFLGLINVLVGGLMGIARNKDVKFMGGIVAGMGAWDLLASNVPQLNALKIPRTNAITAQMLGTSYSTGYRPVSRVAAAGLGYGHNNHLNASYHPVTARGGLGASYEVAGRQTVGLATGGGGSTLGCDLDGVDWP